MVTWIKKFFSDDTAFVGYVRGAFLGIGALAATGQLPIPEKYKSLGAIMIALGGMLRAGDKNKAP